MVLGATAVARVPAAPVTTTSAAAAAAAPRKACTSKTGFKIPVRLSAQDRVLIQELQLYVKMMPNGSWTKERTGGPETTVFEYRAPQDGEYWFRLVRVMKGGSMVPPDVAKAEPNLIVVVDTKAPECELKAEQLPSGEMVLKCDVRDANPEPSKTKLECFMGDKGWQVLEAYPGMPGCFKVTDPAQFRCKVRATLGDAAGNTAVREFGVTNAAEVSVPVPAPTLPAPAPALAPQSSVVPALMPANVASSPVLPASVEGQAEKLMSSSNVPYLTVSSKHVALSYEVDGGATGKLEIWTSTDDGQNWQHLCDDTARKSAAEFDLPGEGRYCVCLVPSGADGVCKPPVKGTTPDCCIEVDATQPVANLVAVRQGTSKEDAGMLMITWTASDKNLKSQPIDLYYATRREGPWVVMAKGLPNDGNFRWHIPADVSGEVHVRMDVTDRAGNVASTVMSSDGRPKARVLGLAPAAQK
jgi:hypothetical protein